MGLKLDKVVPWGRSKAEYLKMFNLTPENLKQQILDCAAGPASFNAAMNKQGLKVVSCDPIYQFTAQEIAQKIEETYDIIFEGVEANKHKYIWKKIKSPQELAQVRMAAMKEFLEDFPLGIQERRYLNYSLPNLPFQSKQFDLALCSHFLFTYSDLLTLDFHRQAITEMLRVATEVRIFPLLNISGKPSLFLQPLLEILPQQGYQVAIQKVEYEFQQGGNQMLIVINNEEL